MKDDVHVLRAGGYLTPAEINNIHIALFRWLPDRIGIADKIGIGVMVIDEANGIIDRMADQQFEKDMNSDRDLEEELNA